MNSESLHVSSNDYEAAYSLTSEIIKHGHKDIGFIKGHPKHSASHLRFNGFVDAIKNNGMESNEQWIKQGNFSFKSGFDAGVEIFHSEKIPTAIFASNDSTCGTTGILGGVPSGPPGIALGCSPCGVGVPGGPSP